MRVSTASALTGACHTLVYHRPVGKAGLQHQVLREAVENQSPDVIIVDEISTPDEVEAARSIAQRGVRLIATIHGAPATPCRVRQRRR